jgi:hypothetical protein
MSCPAIPDEQALVSDLCHRIRVVAAGCFPDPETASTILEKLVQRGEFKSDDVVATEFKGVELLHHHLPQACDPNWESLERELKCRWSSLLPQPVRVYFASCRTINRLGGDMPGRLTQLDALSHDLGIGSTFIHLCGCDSRFREAWTPEERIPEAYGQVHPDALLADEDGPRVVLEFCGMYSAERLKRLGDCAGSLNLPLQLWTVVGANPHG